MAVERNDPIYRNAERRKKERRMKQEKRRDHAELVVNIKIVLLWMIYAVVVFAFIGALEVVLSHRIILKWIIFFSFVGASAPVVYEMEKNIKKSPRCGNTIKGQRK